MFNLGKKRSHERDMAVTRMAYIAEADFEYLISLFVTSDLLVYILKEFVENDALKGIISSIGTFALLAQFMALFFAGRRVKRVVTISHIINQASFALLYFLPLIPLPSAAKTPIFLVLLLCGHVLNNAINSPKITWLMRAVPDNKRGSFTSVKEMISLVSGMALSMGLGFLAEYMEKTNQLPTYYIICAVSLVALTALHTATLIISKEPPLPENVKPLPPKDALKQVFKVPSISKVMAVGVLWNIATGFSLTFFASYKQDELAFDIGTIMLITVIGNACRFLASPLLGKFADKFSFSRSMALCLGIAGLGFLLNTFTVPATRWLFLVFWCLYCISMAGINSGSINLIFDFVPFEGRQAAMGLKNALGGICSFLASLIAAAILALIQANGGFHLFGITLYAQQVLSFLTFFLIALLLVYIKFVIFPLQKKREIEESHRASESAALDASADAPSKEEEHTAV